MKYLFNIGYVIIALLFTFTSTAQITEIGKVNTSGPHFILENDTSFWFDRDGVSIPIGSVYAINGKDASVTVSGRVRDYMTDQHLSDEIAVGGNFGNNIYKRYVNGKYDTLFISSIGFDEPEIMGSRIYFTTGFYITYFDTVGDSLTSFIRIPNTSSSDFKMTQSQGFLYVAGTDSLSKGVLYKVDTATHTFTLLDSINKNPAHTSPFAGVAIRGMTTIDDTIYFLATNLDIIIGTGLIGTSDIYKWSGTNKQIIYTKQISATNSNPPTDFAMVKLSSGIKSYALFHDGYDTTYILQDPIQIVVDSINSLDSILEGRSIGLNQFVISTNISTDSIKFTSGNYTHTDTSLTFNRVSNDVIETVFIELFKNGSSIIDSSYSITVVNAVLTVSNDTLPISGIEGNSASITLDDLTITFDDSVMGMTVTPMLGNINGSTYGFPQVTTNTIDTLDIQIYTAYDTVAFEHSVNVINTVLTIDSVQNVPDTMREGTFIVLTLADIASTTMGNMVSNFVLSNCVNCNVSGDSVIVDSISSYTISTFDIEVVSAFGDTSSPFTISIVIEDTPVITSLIPFKKPVQKEVSIYPNPVRIGTNVKVDVLNFTTNTLIQLYNVTGQFVKEVNYNEIQTQDLSEGTYLIHVFEGKNRVDGSILIVQ